jgi:1,4-dihydroxy-2-naphthoate octaprenyltransferase
VSALAWIRAARLPAQSNIAVPLLLGQALAVRDGARPSAACAALVFAFGLFFQLAIVFANDVADEETDATNATFTPFSGGSRVLPKKEIAPAVLLRAAVGAGACAGLASAAVAYAQRTPAPLLLWVAACALLHAYSFAPVRASYRGGGEILQVLGTGVVLPLFGFVGQRGTLASFPWPMLLAIAPIRLACAIATALPDEPSDRASSKRTLPVAIGSLGAGGVMALLAAVSIGLAARSAPGAKTLLAIPAALAAIAFALSRAEPGTRAMIVRVGAAVSATLAFEGVLAYWALSR